MLSRRLILQELKLHESAFSHGNPKFSYFQFISALVRIRLKYEMLFVQHRTLFMIHRVRKVYELNEHYMHGN